MIIMLFLALVLFIVYFIHTFHYSRHWMENFEETLAFSEEKAEITIVKSRRFARFVRLHRRNYFNLLRNKLSQWTH